MNVKCPAENGGILEQIRKNEDGLTGRLRYKFIRNEAVSYIFETSYRNSKSEITEKFDGDNPSGHDQKRGIKAIQEVVIIYRNYCINTENREHFDKMMERNRKAMEEY